MILPSKDSEERKKAKKKYMQEWRKKNRPQINKYQRERNNKIRPKLRANAKEYYAKNRPKLRAYQNKRYNENPEKSKKEARERRAKGEKRRTILKIKIFYIYSKKLSNSKIPCCNCCKEKFSHEFLAIDHIDGRKSMGHKKDFGGKNLYNWIIKNKFPDGLQVLCYNCNAAKEHGKCPHQKLN